MKKQVDRVFIQRTLEIPGSSSGLLLSPLPSVFLTLEQVPHMFVWMLLSLILEGAWFLEVWDHCWLG